MRPSSSSAANAYTFEKIAVKPVPIGKGSLPHGSMAPHLWRAPWRESAANAFSVEKMAVKPVPLGAPVQDPR